MRIPTHRLPEPQPGGPSTAQRPATSARLGGGTIVFRSPDAAEIRWPASLSTVSAVAALAAEREAIRHLVLSVTLDGPDVVLHARVKDPGDTAARDRLRVLLERVR